jgi:hypothetical protein
MQEPHGSPPQRNVVPVADKLTGKCDRRTHVLDTDPISIRNPLWAVAGG